LRPHEEYHRVTGQPENYKRLEGEAKEAERRISKLDEIVREGGRPRLTFALPNIAALDNLTHVLADLFAQTQHE
jgi:hypothetical protein